MVAVYDYNPIIDSPNANPDLELPFIKGQTITVYGDMVSITLIVLSSVCTCVQSNVLIICDTLCMSSPSVAVILYRPYSLDLYTVRI